MFVLRPPVHALAVKVLSTVVVTSMSRLVVLTLRAVVGPFSAIWYTLMSLGRRREQAGQPVLPAWMRQPSPQAPGQA
ncbi:MAG: hypothetical protein IPL36_14165 [Nigerium sp.]|nr:hypothetical protein [Nigerium sp.]